MFQRWHDLLFAHWPVPPEKIRPLVPEELDLDVFDGCAWVGVIPFWMSAVRIRGCPPVPTTSTFPELNVRTYVRGPRPGNNREGQKPGVYFFSLDAGSRLAASCARVWVGLPYYFASMEVESGGEVHYKSIRRQSARPAEFIASYRPTGPVLRPSKPTPTPGLLGTPVPEQKSLLAEFVTERYCLYVVRRGVVHRLQIHHLPWPLQPAMATFDVNTMAEAAGIQLPDMDPVLQFAKSLEVYIWPPERIRD